MEILNNIGLSSFIAVWWMKFEHYCKSYSVQNLQVIMLGKITVTCRAFVWVESTSIRSVITIETPIDPLVCNLLLTLRRFSASRMQRKTASSGIITVITSSFWRIGGKNTFGEVSDDVTKRYHQIFSRKNVKQCMLSVLITVAARSTAWTVFARPKTGIVVSNPTQDIDVCVCFYFELCRPVYVTVFRQG
jgi:hypothetical protein